MMDIYTVGRDFLPQTIIDSYESVIWTERFLGDGDFELVVPAGSAQDLALPKNQLVMCSETDAPMILESREIKDGVTTTQGISLPKWLNNRIIRFSSDWTIKEWPLGSYKAGHHMCYLVQKMCVAGSEIFDGSWPIGIPVAQVATWEVDGLVIGTTDASGPNFAPSIPFGQLYDVLRQLGETYEVGMNILVDFATDSGFQISYNTFSGTDRRSSQSVNPTLRFSEEMDNYTNIRDLETTVDSKTHVYVFAPNADPSLIGWAGSATNWSGATGFDLRVIHEYSEDIDMSTVTTSGQLQAIVDQKAALDAAALKAKTLVDGEVIQTGPVKFGTDYFLGDLVEVEGNTGVRKEARVTEYIRSKDSAGSKAYPTLTILD